MMGRQSKQLAMVLVDMESLIPENHLLRKIDRMVSFDFIYELLAPYYSATGPSICRPCQYVQNASGRISVWDQIRTTVS